MVFFIRIFFVVLSSAIFTCYVYSEEKDEGADGKSSVVSRSNFSPSTKFTNLTEKNWFSVENGRTKYLFGTKNPKKIEKFVPSGRMAQEKIIGPWKIILRPAVYYSNEENPDISKDRPASIVVYSLKNSNGKKVWNPRFAGKGYKFSILNSPQTESSPLFMIRYWSGVMGCSFIDLSFFSNPDLTNQPLIEYRSTGSVTTTNRLGDLCKPHTSFLLFFN